MLLPNPAIEYHLTMMPERRRLLWSMHIASMKLSKVIRARDIQYSGSTQAASLGLSRASMKWPKFYFPRTRNNAHRRHAKDSCVSSTQSILMAVLLKIFSPSLKTGFAVRPVVSGSGSSTTRTMKMFSSRSLFPLSNSQQPPQDDGYVIICLRRQAVGSCTHLATRYVLKD